ncbi:hypothetical protein DUNSADRAFT_6560 [Dunaliella salina]|uniref:Uncharacterized protein n=1 Tax=Dunaliella salina TaxID=3046 RepID=A0ABQ7GN54_DUNSA|nr:hypothetical protein DUNSADRAFT_6560 [Dunaliella salina]|eukprot:KAF5836039.1 hypothetical protein DUNSADRAFT_6560 [Dunaliella salina]
MEACRFFSCTGSCLLKGKQIAAQYACWVILTEAFNYLCTFVPAVCICHESWQHPSLERVVMDVSDTGYHSGLVFRGFPQGWRIPAC